MVRPERVELPTFWFVASRKPLSKLSAFNGNTQKPDFSALNVLCVGVAGCGRLAVRSLQKSLHPADPTAPTQSTSLRQSADRPAAQRSMYAVLGRVIDGRAVSRRGTRPCSFLAHEKSRSQFPTQREAGIQPGPGAGIFLKGARS